MYIKVSYLNHHRSFINSDMLFKTTMISQVYLITLCNSMKDRIMHTNVVVVVSRKHQSMIKHRLFDENPPSMSKTAKSFTNMNPKSKCVILDVQMSVTTEGDFWSIFHN